MPFWKIYHPKDVYTAHDKHQMATAITAVYAPYMPKFYVGIIFEEVNENAFYIGGEPHGRFVRIAIDHIARAMPSEEIATRFITMISTAIAPWIKDRGLEWELHIDETPFMMWTVQGIFPPRQGTEDEARWIAENRPSPLVHPR